MLPENTRGELARYRFARAEQMRRASQTAFAQEDWVTTNNRAYYCLFHAMRSVLALDGMDFKKHSAVISYFNQHYVATDVFDRSYGAKFSNAFAVRNHSDYDDFYLFSREETVALMKDAEQFLEDVRMFLAEKDVL